MFAVCNGDRRLPRLDISTSLHYCTAVKEKALVSGVIWRRTFQSCGRAATEQIPEQR